MDKSFKLLEKFKIPVPKFGLAKDEKQAVEIAKRVKYPVVLKIVSPQIVHKTDVGAIVKDVKNEEQLKESYKKIFSNVKKKVPKANIQGVLVQHMIGDGECVIIGGKKDSQFGQVVMFGGGGVLVELIQDTSFRVVPISKSDAKEMMEETKVYQVIRGFRGKKYDVNAVMDILLKTSKLLKKNPAIAELDINPVIVLSKKAFAVDVRIAVG